MNRIPGDRGRLLAAALEYAERGWHVFPLRPRDKRPAFPDHAEARCTGRDPRCRRAERHVSWEERATTDPARITAAWTSATYGIGIATGPSGLLVIDLDQPKTGRPGAARPPVEWEEPGIADGADVFALLCRRAGQPVPWDTHTVRTGSGGLHLYFTPPTGARLRCTAGSLGWLIDTRAHGGYVVAPPTTVAGREYVTEYGQSQAEPLPEWLGEALTPRPLPVQGPTPVRLLAGTGRVRAYLEAALSRAAEAIQTSGPGQHNRALYGAAVQLGQLVAGGALTAETVRAELLPAAIAVGQSEAEAHRTITSGLSAGADRPRTLPGTTLSHGAVA
ncbi:hypothetical protein GCM10022223_39000 [Kineosporia mesophila]|uniref:DNA primase/polymerase bifunctional N-terminal domain-containing protein n=1 Tax=Kineosporia mesophila TaxID=566012 RepID=A0ABP6ZWC1_9ACTN|nr:bifunctional DNA primase/polymerase [Kineosporia mesophila]MCD5348525.1 bifunctional DNA primase/polymerase [Kineosporia mesophila]